MYDSVSTNQEWGILKQHLKVSIECEMIDLEKCWKSGEGVLGNASPKNDKSLSFMDVAGRSWATFSLSENMFFVDTNGFKPPNRFGKDRFYFSFQNNLEKRTNDASYYVKIGPSLEAGEAPSDFTVYDKKKCQHPPCYYKSWLK